MSNLTVDKCGVEPLFATVQLKDDIIIAYEPVWAVWLQKTPVWRKCIMASAQWKTAGKSTTFVKDGYLDLLDHLYCSKRLFNLFIHQKFHGTILGIWYRMIPGGWLRPLALARWQLRIRQRRPRQPSEVTSRRQWVQRWRTRRKLGWQISAVWRP